MARSLLAAVVQVMYPTLTNSPLQKQTATAAIRRPHTASLKPKQRTQFSPDVALAAMFQKDAGFSAAEMASHVSVLTLLALCGRSRMLLQDVQLAFTVAFI
jgi:hypothetical protein